MEAGDLKTFLTDSVGQPPEDFESDLDHRNRYLDWWSLKIREHYGVVNFNASPVEFGDASWIPNICKTRTFVTTISFDAFEASFYIKPNDATSSVLFVRSQVHDGPVDYLDDWFLQYK